MKLKTIFLLITIVCTAIVLIDGFFDLPLFPMLSANLVNWVVVIGLMALATAVINLMQIHTKRIIQRKKNWFYSAYFVIVFLVVTFIGIIEYPNGATFSFIIKNIYTPLATTIYSLLGLWMATAAYKAFRLRSFNSLVLLLSGVIVLLGSTTFGAAISPVFSIIATYIRIIPTTIATRAILISTAIGTIALGLRILLGIESPFSTKQD
ncbi:hypothetical protein IMX26_10025 [Clostridium sp. 'deep sea']|uniref:hypothetical protein n=1 Tax=Clostridium sp. 'deep sea' TaxID=2779445 RepID=UPI0018968DE8|nr:hypothetical protein [Clostridium sp. 'deep sea']QOR33839.1 hypothetical protein IMX26_10025 [Clostridium sp. 'deep sea']